MYISVDIVSTAKMRQHLIDFGLVSKEPEWLHDGVQLLGLQERSTCLGENEVTRFPVCLAFSPDVVWKAGQALPCGWIV